MLRYLRANHCGTKLSTFPGCFPNDPQLVTFVTTRWLTHRFMRRCLRESRVPLAIIDLRTVCRLSQLGARHTCSVSGTPDDEGCSWPSQHRNGLRVKLGRLRILALGVLHVLKI